MEDRQSTETGTGTTRRESFKLFGGIFAIAAGCGDPDQPDPSVSVSNGPPSPVNPGHPGPETNVHAPDVGDAVSFPDSSATTDSLTNDFGDRVLDVTAGEDANLRPPADTNHALDEGEQPPDEGQPPLDEGLPPEDPGQPTPDPGETPDEGQAPLDEGLPPEDSGQPTPDPGEAPDNGQAPLDEGQPPEDVETIAPMEVVITAEGNNLNNGTEVLVANFWIDIATDDSGKISDLTFNITPENWPQFYGINVYLADENYKPLTPFQTIGKPGDNDKALTVSFELPQTPIQKGKTLIKVMLKSLTSIPKAQDTLMQITTNLVAAKIASDKGPNQEVQTNLDNAVAVSTNQFNT